MKSHAELVEHPITGPASFDKKDWPAILSQTALLLALGRQLHLMRRAMKPWLPASNAAAVAVLSEGPVAAVLEAERQSYQPSEFPVPLLRSHFADLPHTFGLTPQDALPAEPVRPPLAPVPYEPATAHALAEKVFAEPEPENARQLLQHCLSHRHELVRVAASVSLFPTTAQPAPLLSAILKACRSRNATVRELAVNALGIVDPQNPALQRFLRPTRRRTTGLPSQTTLLVHGTFARAEAWWQPGGDFHSLLSTVRSDVYAAADRYDWTGAYSDAARDLAADQLMEWFQQRPEHVRPSLVTHSHGGSVAMLATNKGLQLDTLVLLSCPVHSHKYMPDFANVNRVVSIRVTNDYVILIDGGRQRFNDPRIQEKVLPIWFDHSATHYPDTWQRYDLANVMNLHLP